MGLATNPDLRHRGDAAAARPLRARRGDPVLRHPHRARRDGPGPVLRRGRRPALRRPLRDESGDRAPADVPDLDRSCATCSTRCASIRRALDGRVPLIGFSGSPWTLACYMVEGGGPRTTTAGEEHAVQPPRPAAPHPGGQRRGGGRLPQRADRRRRAGGDGVRHLGRRARRRRVPAVQPRLPARCSRRERTDAAGTPMPRIVFTKGGGLWLEEMAARREVLGVDWTVNLGARARRWAAAWRCRATSIPRAVRAAGAGRRRGARGCWRISARRTPAPAPAHADLQPGTRHQPAHAARTRAGAGGGGALPIRRRCAPRRASPESSASGVP